MCTWANLITHKTVCSIIRMIQFSGSSTIGQVQPQCPWNWTLLAITNPLNLFVILETDNSERATLCSIVALEAADSKGTLIHCQKCQQLLSSYRDIINTLVVQAASHDIYLCQKLVEVACQGKPVFWCHNGLNVFLNTLKPNSAGLTSACQCNGLIYCWPCHDMTCTP